MSQYGCNMLPSIPFFFFFFYLDLDRSVYEHRLVRSSYCVYWASMRVFFELKLEFLMKCCYRGQCNYMRESAENPREMY